MATRLNERNERVLAFVAAHEREHGVAPSTLEIQRALDFADRDSATRALRVLAKRGWLEPSGDERAWSAKVAQVQDYLFVGGLAAEAEPTSLA